MALHLHFKKNIPDTRRFQSVGNMLRSGWLIGAWKNGPLHVGSGCPRQWTGGQRFKQYLAEGTFWHGDGDRENVVIRARVKYDHQDDVPFWQWWFRSTAEFHFNCKSCSRISIPFTCPLQQDALLITSTCAYTREMKSWIYYQGQWDSNG